MKAKLNKSDGLINIDKYIVTSLIILKKEYSEYEQNFDRMIISCKNNINIKNGLFVEDYRVATLSTLYPTISGTITLSL